MDILYLNAKDIDQLGITNDEILEAVEESLRAQGKGQAMVEPRVHIHVSYTHLL